MQSRQATTRSDVVRQKRTSRPRKSKGLVSSRRTPKATLPAQPPILIRGVVEGINTPRRQRGRKTKRRYDIALSTPGAEMRLPSLPRVSIGWRLLSGLLVIGLAGLIYLAWTDPAFEVTALQIKGLQRLNNQDIASVAGILGKPIYLVQPEKIQGAIQAAFPELVSVVVAVKIPAEVQIELVERQPILVWEQDGQTLWVDAFGVAFPPRGEDGPSVQVEAVGWPVPSKSEDNPQSGNAATQLLSVNMVDAILRIKEEAGKKATLVYDSQHGLGWKDSRGWEVFFGTDIEDVDIKMQIYKTLVKRLKKEQVRPELISVEFVNAPYYRLER